MNNTDKNKIDKTKEDTNKNPDTNKTDKKEEYSKYNIFKNHSYGSLYQRIQYFLNTKLINLILFILLIFTIVITTYLLRSNTLHKNHKFNVFLQLLSSLGALALGATLILTIVSQKETNAMQAIQNFDKRMKKILDMHVKSPIFLENWEIYKKTIATSMLIGYMKHHYNL